MIALHGAAKTYQLPGGRPLTALQPTDLAVERGEFVVITGRSGSGKTTLLNIAAGLTQPSSGRVTFGDVDLWSLSDVEQSHLRNRSMGFVFQFPSLLPALDVLRNVTLPLAFAPEDVSDGRGRAEELLEMVGLGDRNGAYPRELSAGQQQRVVIARALIGRPELLLADEPSSDLDEETENEIMALFSRIHKETGVTILMVTHTRQLVAYGSRHVEMKSGALHTEADESRGQGGYT